MSFEYLFSQMKRSIVRVLNATVPTMKGEEPYIDLPESLLLGYYLEEGCSPWKSNAFSIGTYRSDFMVDELTLRPIMTEVQSNFGAGYKTSAKKYIIPPLFRGMVDIVHEVTHLRSAGRPVNEVVNNISPAHFHLLINEADDFYDDKIKKNRNFKCKSTDGIRCDKYKDPEYTVEIKNKFDDYLSYCYTICDGCGHCGSGVPANLTKRRGGKAKANPAKAPTAKGNTRPVPLTRSQS